ncbi:MAG: hypothetical protein WB502_02600 [Thermoactinomyces sp.]
MSRFRQKRVQVGDVHYIDGDKVTVIAISGNQVCFEFEERFPGDCPQHWVDREFFFEMVGGY